MMRKPAAKHLRAWFFLTKEERLMIGGVLAIALIGLVARYQHQKNQHIEPYDFESVVQQNNTP